MDATKETQYKVLTSNVLKWIAIIAMTLDHLASALWSGHTTNAIALIMHILGRLTLPIMCYMMAEGYVHTKNLKKYIGRMFLFALVSHVPYVFRSPEYVDPLSFIPFTHGSYFNQTSVLWSLAWGLVLIRIHDSNLKFPIKLLLSFLVLVASLPGNWSCFAPLIVLMFWYCRGNFTKQMIFMMALTLVYVVIYVFAIDLVYGLAQLGVGLSIPVLRLYNGKLGHFPQVNKALKWVFYIYYPLHLAVIGLLLFFGVFPVF